jgi:hypothetical protein
MTAENLPKSAFHEVSTIKEEWEEKKKMKKKTNKQTINKNIQTEDMNEELLVSVFQFSLFLAISTSSFSTLLGFS